ncbi:riboflavin synthase [Candidatus Formimonas warabiya]|uniref:Riboflavin synthase n=1 Tax=Formimonas warabiya TaxID=1761012 RepID=A0A3G1KQG7_FORW1|nr:riboflavin synthase [Candidatus Formimonas warabiya]ATW24688.1 riboflavin synthase subunit alpha [Candidatus Formimonas warabiya]
MFTGLIEELGTVSALAGGENSARITVAARIVLEQLNIGDSIAVNGVCLTVVDYGKSSFQADVMRETLLKSSLGALKTGDKVNLERALRLGDRLGGHLVSGHIDGVGVIINQQVVDIAVVTEIQTGPALLKYVIPKGSVAVDGISLTVVEVKKDSFTVSLIPHTAKVTTLGYKKKGDTVNLEGDLIGKYIERFMGWQDQGSEKPPSRVSLDFLAEHGFA